MELLLAPKTQEAARFFGAGQVLPCMILEKHESGAEVSTPLGNLTVPHGDSLYNPASPFVFIPEDAVLFEAAAPLKSFNARFTGSLFEGSGLIFKLLLGPWENAAENQFIPFEAAAGKRTKAPEPGSVIRLWVDQSLIRFVK